MNALATSATPPEAAARAAPPPPPRKLPVARQQILRGDESYHHGIRYRLLKPTELDALELKAAKLLAMEDVDPDTQFARLRQIRLNEGVKAMLVAVTRDPVMLPPPPPETRDDEGKKIAAEPAPDPDLADPALWEPVGITRLSQPGVYDEFFSGTDHTYLRGLFAVKHEIDAGTADKIVKKEQTVSTG